MVVANQLNALSTVVLFDARDADSARVVYWSDSEPPRATPYTTGRGMQRVTTLGLLPSTTYFHVVERVSAGQVTVSDTVQVATGELPPYLQTVHMQMTGTPTSGFVLTAVADTGRTSFTVAFDSTGQLRWYREFPGELPAGETKQQKNGDFTTFLGRTPGWIPFPGYYVEFRPSGEFVRTIAAPPPLYTDDHELVLTFSDSNKFEAAHFFGFSIRQTDLSQFGLASDAQVAGHQLIRMTDDGVAHTILDGWDHFTWEDRIEPPRDTLFDFDHPNALDFDHDGNYIVSYRNMGTIAKIDAKTGEIIWLFGGRNNQFEIRGDPLNGFSAQHSVRVMDNGDILLYDNGTRHDPPETRAVEYRLDPVAKTADMVWQFRHDPVFWVPYTGSVQRLESGNTVIGYSNRGIVTEVRQDGSVAWEGTIMLDSTRHGDFYRAIKIASLYGYQRP